MTGTPKSRYKKNPRLHGSQEKLIRWIDKNSVYRRKVLEFIEKILSETR